MPSINRPYSRAHSDPIEERIPKAWSLTSSVSDIIPDSPASSAAASSTVAPENFRVCTRAQARRQRELNLRPAVVPTSSARNLPSCYGGCFVECELRVVVRPAAGTGMEFDPRRIHGTTKQWNRITRACAFTTSTYIWDSYRRAMEGACVEAGLRGTGADNE